MKESKKELLEMVVYEPLIMAFLLLCQLKRVHPKVKQTYLNLRLLQGNLSMQQNK